MYSNHGFTLVEIMIVILIIATLAGIGTPLMARHLERVKRVKSIQEIRTIEKEIIIFEGTYYRYPTDLSEIGFDSLLDSWGNPYKYLPVAGTPKGKLRKDHFMVPVNTDFDLYSMGPDGKSQAPFTAKASRDDIVRANNGQFIGPVSQY